MDERLLTIDLGNSRLKARCWLARAGSRTELEASFEEGGDAAGVAALDEWLAARESIGRGGLSAVGSKEIERALLERLRARCADFVEGLESGVELRVRTPDTMGSDRSFAARGAADHVKGSALVVGAGTALTVDAVRFEKDSRPALLGGAIAPGPALLARSLALGAARLPAIEPRPGPPALGQDTAAAIQSGVAIGFEGAALRLIDRVGAESGIRGPLVLTGGAARFLERVLHERGERVHHVPDLVHHGILAALGARPPTAEDSLEP
jgi:type III pantothenate kinase